MIQEINDIISSQGKWDPTEEKRLPAVMRQSIEERSVNELYISSFKRASHSSSDDMCTAGNNYYLQEKTR